MSRRVLPSAIALTALGCSMVGCGTTHQRLASPPLVQASQVQAQGTEVPQTRSLAGTLTDVSVDMAHVVDTSNQASNSEAFKQDHPFGTLKVASAEGAATVQCGWIEGPSSGWDAIFGRPSFALRAAASKDECGIAPIERVRLQDLHVGMAVNLTVTHWWAGKDTADWHVSRVQACYPGFCPPKPFGSL